MKVTEQQLLVMFDILKGSLYAPGDSFAGYKKEDIMKILNDIISQQDNDTLLTIEDDTLSKEDKISIDKDILQNKDNFWENE